MIDDDDVTSSPLSFGERAGRKALPFLLVERMAPKMTLYRVDSLTPHFK